jgi:hypothetical protein
MAISSPDQQRSLVSRQVMSALEQVCTLGASILKAQAAMLRLDPSNLQAEDLELLHEPLVRAVERFTSPLKAERLSRSLRELRPVLSAPPVSGPRNSFGVQTRARDSQVAPDSFAGRVLEALRLYSPLAWPLLEAQCSRAGLEAVDLTAAQLQQLMPTLEKSLARFTSPPRAAAARETLELLIDGHLA